MGARGSEMGRSAIWRIFIPRPDHEVVIEFINGDPDRRSLPAVSTTRKHAALHVARQLHAKRRKDPQPYPRRRRRREEFNELRFEDKQGSEDIYFHAQKDFHRVVENDDDLKVGHDQTIEIKNNRTEVVKDGNEKVTIETGQSRYLRRKRATISTRSKWAIGNALSTWATIA